MSKKKEIIYTVDEFKNKQMENYNSYEFDRIFNKMAVNDLLEHGEEVRDLFVWAFTEFPNVQYEFLTLFSKLDELALSDDKKVLDILLYIADKVSEIDVSKFDIYEDNFVKYRDNFIEFLDLRLDGKCKCYESHLFTFPDLEKSVDILDSETFENKKEYSLTTNYTVKCKICGKEWIATVENHGNMRRYNWKEKSYKK